MSGISLQPKRQEPELPVKTQSVAVIDHIIQLDSLKSTGDGDRDEGNTVTPRTSQELLRKQMSYWCLTAIKFEYHCSYLERGCGLFTHL